MILDHIENFSRYHVPYRDHIQAFLKRDDVMHFADGEYEIEGRNLFVRVACYDPKPAHENKFEAHRVYADCQVLLQGIELMQIAPRDALSAIGEYEVDGDCQFFTATQPMADFVVREGEFAFFFPGEAHRPACRFLSDTGRVRKFVFKIRMA